LHNSKQFVQSLHSFCLALGCSPQPLFKVTRHPLLLVACQEQERNHENAQGKQDSADESDIRYGQRFPCPLSFDNYGNGSIPNKRGERQPYCEHARLRYEPRILNRNRFTRYFFPRHTQHPPNIARLFSPSNRQSFLRHSAHCCLKYLTKVSAKV